MAKLLVEEPDALMRARPGLWEPWGGNDPGPPGPPHRSGALSRDVKGWPSTVGDDRNAEQIQEEIARLKRVHKFGYEEYFGDSNLQHRIQKWLQGKHGADPYGWRTNCGHDPADARPTPQR